MNKLGALVSIFFIFSVSNTFAKGTEIKAMEVFDAICLKNQDDFSNINHYVKLFDAKQLTKEQLSFDPVLRKNNGVGFVFKHEDMTYLNGYVKDTSCSIATANVSTEELEILVRKNYKIKQEFTNDSGMQVVKMFRIDPNSIYNDNDAIIFLTYGKYRVKEDFVAMGFILGSSVNNLLNR